MNDGDAIRDAYFDTVQQLYKTLLQRMTEAEGDQAKEAEAEAAFKKGVALARHAQSRAISALP